MFFAYWPFVAAAACTAILMPVAMFARSIGRDHGGRIQTTHVASTSRLGGVVIFIAFFLTVALAQAMHSPSLWAAAPLAVTALPVLLGGLAEDVTRAVRPRYRLLAALASAALASAYAGGVVPKVDLPLVDDLLGHAWIVLPLTWFMVVGACNAVNIIDGAHGLAAGTALIMFSGIALAAGWSGDDLTLAPTLVVMGTLVGFLLWNYPHGRIFLGDSGAYFVGFMYAELSIQLIARNSGISAWYVIVLAGYPIVDTLVAMYRRGIVRRMPLMEPDALHLHTLLFRRVAIPIERRRRDMNLHRANARVAPLLWLHSAFLFVLAALFHDNTPALWCSLLVYAVFYMLRYRSLVRFGRRRQQDLPAQQRADLAKPLH